MLYDEKWSEISKAERTFTSLADKLYFLCELSWEMLSNDQMHLNYRDFPDRIRKLFGSVVQTQIDLDHWHYEMMGQTMLNRNSDGDYTPVHRSFLEFFVAYKLAAELGVLAPDFTELAQAQSHMDTSVPPQSYTWSSYFKRDVDQKGSITAIAPLQKFSCESLEKLHTSIAHKKLPQAITDLIMPMFDSSEESLEPLRNVLRSIQGKTESEVGHIGGNIVTLLLKENPFIFENFDLNNTVILETDFSIASLKNV